MPGTDRGPQCQVLSGSRHRWSGPCAHCSQRGGRRRLRTGLPGTLQRNVSASPSCGHSTESAGRRAAGREKATIRHGLRGGAARAAVRFSQATAPGSVSGSGAIATDRAIVAVLFQGGLRRSEAAALRWADVQDAADGRSWRPGLSLAAPAPGRRRPPVVRPLFRGFVSHLQRALHSVTAHNAEAAGRTHRLRCEGDQSDRQRTDVNKCGAGHQIGASPRYVAGVLAERPASGRRIPRTAKHAEPARTDPNR